jgi:pimeloyl-ACP methyl ester carboxylesterase
MQLPEIETPVLIIAGKNDPTVPAGNVQVLAERLPHYDYVLLSAGHRAWEEAASEYGEQIVVWDRRR